MAIKNAPPRPTPTPTPTLSAGGNPPVSLPEFDNDAAVEVAVDENIGDMSVGDDDEEGEDVAVAVVPSSSVMLK